MKKHNITFFDLETTGLNVKECGIVSIYAINYKKKITIDSLINPEMDIPIEASNVHGILENDIKDKPIFKNIIKPINYLFPQSEYVCGYNICRLCGTYLDNIINEGQEWVNHENDVVDKNRCGYIYNDLLGNYSLGLYIKGGGESLKKIKSIMMWNNAKTLWTPAVSN